MSRVSDFEKKARKSRAMSILNGFRHTLKDREVDFGEKEAEVLKDAVEFCRTKENNILSPKMVIYSTRCVSNVNKSAAIQIYESLGRAIQIESKREGRPFMTYLDLLEKLLESTSNEFPKEEKDRAVRLMSMAMKVITSNSTYSRTNVV